MLLLLISPLLLYIPVSAPFRATKNRNWTSKYDDHFGRRSIRLCINLKSVQESVKAGESSLACHDFGWTFKKSQNCHVRFFEKALREVRDIRVSSCSQ